MADFNITLNMNQGTVDYLNRRNYCLYSIKFPAISFSASPLIWFIANNFLESTHLQWNKSYEAFISNQLDYTAGTVITAYSSQTMSDDIAMFIVIPSASSAGINLGQQMIVSDGGALSIGEGQKDQIEIINNSNETYAFGLNQSIDSSKATPLFISNTLMGGARVVMKPLTEKVLLIFSSSQPSIETSMVVDKAFNQGGLISLSSTETSRDVTFDKDNGWLPEESVWIERIAGGDDLTRFYSGV